MFRNVSIITARNAQKDRINQLGCHRFAEENNQLLALFYCRSKRTYMDPIRKDNNVPLGLQKLLWKQPHSTSNVHIPAQLDLCMGMPMMLRQNSATECCMTKGVEGTIAGWKSLMVPSGKAVLDILFVKLTNLPKTVKFGGLPENVVPVTRNSVSTECSLPNDHVVCLNHEQVLVLPNFAMTDYLAQGRTRPYNVVDLNSCTKHQSYYTCLSWSSSAAGTIIVEGFDPKVDTRGWDGHLWQEF
ncbi:hypothetical protein FIBSPDRAFT_914319 [Athelia psychrophila]|uniref:Uncharacterized protein n=1 Tax=Athelia psychrophila TaxID=1759441 RepID=A0A165X5R5_9AGAM|nr:hypothetical protein FIBSPDRAFT_914319 [Fibularhizoctonia sp. CBS 109695]